MPKIRRTSPIPKLQADATLTQPNPTSGNQYTVLSTKQNVVVLGAAVKVTWTVQPDPLEMHFVIDGQTITHTVVNPVSGSWYYPINYAAAAETSQGLSTTAQPNQDGSYAHRGRSVKVLVEITGGTVSEITARVKYARY